MTTKLDQIRTAQTSSRGKGSHGRQTILLHCTLEEFLNSHEGDHVNSFMGPGCASYIRGKFKLVGSSTVKCISSNKSPAN